MVGVRADGLHPVYRNTTGVESQNEHSTSACLRNSCVFIQTVSRTNPVSLTHNDTGLNQNHSRLTSRSETNSRSREANLHRGAEIDSYIHKVTLYPQSLPCFIVARRGGIGSSRFFRDPWVRMISSVFHRVARTRLTLTCTRLASTSSSQIAKHSIYFSKSTNPYFNLSLEDW